jgi:hypothetical protein
MLSSAVVTKFTVLQPKLYKSDIIAAKWAMTVDGCVLFEDALQRGSSVAIAIQFDCLIASVV